MARELSVARRSTPIRAGRRSRQILIVSLQPRNLRSAAAAEQGSEEEPVARRTRSRRRAAAAISVLHLDVLIWEILARLPAAALLRCRAVCRSWRGLTSDPGFLLAHHRRQPSLPLIEVVLDGRDTNRAVGPPGSRPPVLGFNDHLACFKLRASRDGLLLLSLSNGCFSICNPATRQCAPVPALRDAHLCSNIEALYPHQPSGEYRVLYWLHTGTDHDAVSYYVLAVPRGREPRCIAASPGMKLDGMSPGNSSPPILFRGCLCWDPSRWSSHAGVGVFDTVAESFRSMRCPVAAAVVGCHSTRLHDMEGLIGLSCFDSSTKVAKIWVLEDHQREVWSLKYQIKPLDFMPRLVLSRKGDMLAYDYDDTGYYVVHRDRNGKLLEEFRWPESCYSKITGHLFKESLVKHAFFPKRGSSRFFRRL